MYSYSSLVSALGQSTVDQLGRRGNYRGVDVFYANSDAQRQWLDFLLDYYNRAKTLKGTDYYQQVQNNPFLSYQGFEGLDGSSLSTALNDRMNRANDVLLDIMSTWREDRYNSAVSQVSRDRAAGINDALSGDIAGTTPAAAVGRDETSPIPGISPETALAKEQFEFQQGVVGVQTGLQVLQTGASFLKGFLDFSGLLSNIRLQSAQKDAVEEGISLTASQRHGQDISNREALKESFLKQFSDSIPFQDGQKFDSQSVLNAFPLDAYNPDEQEYFKQLLDSGFFFGTDGTPSTALQRAYTGDLAGVARNIEGIARSGSLVGGNLSDPSGAIESYMRDYAVYERLNLQANASRSALLVSYQDLQNEIAKYNGVQAMYEAQSAGAQAAEDVSMSEYNQQLYNRTTGEAQRNLENAVRNAEMSLARYNESVSNFRSYVNDKYMRAYKAGMEGGASTLMIAYYNFLQGAALDGFNKFNAGAAMMPDISGLISTGMSIASKRVPLSQGTNVRNFTK